MYNDQPDVGDPGSDYGHTKGVVGVGDSSSFWLVHSVPNFPQSTGSSKFFFPSTETDYGQVCLDSARQPLSPTPSVQPTDVDWGKGANRKLWR